MAMTLVRHRQHRKHQGARVAGVRGNREYLVDPEGYLREVVGGTPGEPGCHPEDAAEYSQYSSTFEVLGPVDGGASAAEEGATPVPPDGRRSPPPPPPPKRPGQRPPAPGGHPWGWKEGDEDPGTYASRLPPADHKAGHNALTEAKWQELFELVAGIALAPKPHDVSKAEWVQGIRDAFADLDKALAAP